jgi:hypothetical protein
LVQSVRTGRGSRQRVVAYLGELKRSEQSGWAQLGRNLSGKQRPSRSLFDPPHHDDPGVDEPVLVRLANGYSDPAWAMHLVCCWRNWQRSKAVMLFYLPKASKVITTARSAYDALPNRTKPQKSSCTATELLYPDVSDVLMRLLKCSGTNGKKNERKYLNINKSPLITP